MLIKKGSKGNEVKLIQEFLGIEDDGIFGKGTENAVKRWQKENGLVDDGVVGPATWNAMGIISTDNSETAKSTESGILINKSYLSKDEYSKGPIKAEYIFIHHTAGWQNPYNVIKDWENDTRGKIATEFVIGGQSIGGNDNSQDGVIVQAFPHGNYGWHLGTGNNHMHRNSVGIEVCNFGQLEEGGFHRYDAKLKKNVWITRTPGKFYTYSGAEADESQIVKLDQPFRGYQYWHRYSDESLKSLKELIYYIGDRDNIDVTQGLPKLIKEKGVKAFDFSASALSGKIKGILNHTNVRKDKVDMFPQKELMDMLVSL